MNAPSQQTKDWLAAAPLQVQEEIKRVVSAEIREGIDKYAQRVLKPQISFERKSMADDVMQFMIAMDQPPAAIKDFAATPATTLALANMLMFGDDKGFKQGELNEMTDAWAAFCQSRSLEHLVEFVDGAIDSIYVILWTLNKLGVPADACWNEVQRSNMAKLGPDGKPIKDAETGKIKKPEGWQPPDLFGLLSAAASQVTYVGGIAKHEKKSADRWICLACTSQREGFHFPDCTEFARSLNAID